MFNPPSQVCVPVAESSLPPHHRKWPRRLFYLAMALAIGAFVYGVGRTLASIATTPSTSRAQQAWIASWATSPEAPDPDDNEPLLKIEGQTVRQRLRASVGG